MRGLWCTGKGPIKKFNPRSISPIFKNKTSAQKSGKEKAHKHKQNFPVTAWVGESPDRVARGSPDPGSARGLPTGGQGSKVYVLCAEPKEHKHFRPGTRPGGSGTRLGGSVTRVTEKLFMCQVFMCLFRPLGKEVLGRLTSGQKLRSGRQILEKDKHLGADILCGCIRPPPPPISVRHFLGEGG